MKPHIFLVTILIRISSCLLVDRGHRVKKVPPNRGKNSADRDFSVASSPVAEYKGSSSIAKGLVSALTSLSNLIQPNKQLPSIIYNRSALSFNEIRDGIIGDFKRGYLFSGEIDAEIYAQDCLFTDPTLSFRGLATFKRNIASIQPLIRKYLDDTNVILYSISCDESSRIIRTQWRMSGGLKLPWKPRLDLSGQTQFTIGDDTYGGRIVNYYETWNTPASDALLAIFKQSTLQPDYSLIRDDSLDGRVFPVCLSLDAIKSKLLNKLFNPSNDDLVDVSDCIKELAFINFLGPLPLSMTPLSITDSQKWSYFRIGTNSTKNNKSIPQFPRAGQLFVADGRFTLQATSFIKIVSSYYGMISTAANGLVSLNYISRSVSILGVVVSTQILNRTELWVPTYEDAYCRVFEDGLSTVVLTPY